MQASAPYWPLSLRFRSKEMEASYLGSRRPFLVRRVTYLCSIFILGQCLVLLGLLLQQERFTRTAVGYESLVWSLSCSGSIIVIELLLLALICMGRPRSHFLLEAMVIANMVLSMLLAVFSSPRRFVTLKGAELGEVFGSDYDSDSSLLLIIDGFVTVSHLGLPIRWHVMAPLEAAALLVYVAKLALMGTQEPAENIGMNLLVLTLLVGASAFSKRSAEMDERRSFQKMISEKALRCEAEFQLSQVSAAPPRRGEASEAGSSQSEHVTDKSGGIFDALFEGGVEASEQLGVVAAKGESEHWRIQASEVRLLSEGALGSGGFGSVQRAVFCGMLVAVKCPHVEELKLPELCNELRVLRHLRHPHIVTTFGAVVLPEQQQIYLVLELITGVDLSTFLMVRKGQGSMYQQPTVMGRYQVMVGVSRALLYMHTRMPHIVHGDLKGSNIMVEVENDFALAKVLDFGLSRVLHKHSRPLGGTRAWMAPEVMDHGPVRCSADIYSLGHVLAFCATSTPPVWRSLLRRAAQPSWSETSDLSCCKLLVTACLQRQPELRPHIASVFETLLSFATDLEFLSPSIGYLQQLQVMKDHVEGNRKKYLERLKLVAQCKEMNAGMNLQDIVVRRGEKLCSLPENESFEESTSWQTSSMAQKDGEWNRPDRVEL